MKKVIVALVLVFILTPFTIGASSDTSGKNAVALSNFVDTPDNTAIGYFYINGVIDGFPDREFKPDLPITNAQLAKILTKVFKLEPAESVSEDVTFSTAYPFDYIKENHWSYSYICAAGGYLSGCSENFYPDQAVTGNALKNALNNITNTETIGEWMKPDVLTRSEAINILFDFLNEHPYYKSLRISEDETIPKEFSYQYENTVFSNRPMYFSSPEYGSFGTPGAFTGYAYASWSAIEQDAVFYAKVYVEDDCYEFILKELSFCGIDDTMNTIAGKYDILRNGEMVKEAVQAKAYGFENDYFKFYSKDENWHMSADVTSRNIKE